MCGMHSNNRARYQEVQCKNQEVWRLQSPGGFRLRLRSYYGLPKPHLWGGHPGRVRPGWLVAFLNAPKMRFPYTSEFCGIYLYPNMEVINCYNQSIITCHIWVTTNSTKLGRVRKSHFWRIQKCNQPARSDASWMPTPQVWFR